jgi:hypothetical protein
MKIRKQLLIMFLGAFLILSAASVGVAQNISVTPTHLDINEFLIADLGLSGGGRNYEFFRVLFANSGSTSDYKLSIDVETAGGDKLLEGDTDLHQYNTELSDRSFYNYNILDRLGGDFKISSAIPVRLENAILNTGSATQGQFKIVFQLLDDGGTPVGTQGVIIVNVLPLFLISLAPTDGELVNKQKLNFAWLTNMKEGLSLNIYDQPTGGRPVASTRVTGRSFKWPELAALGPLEDGETYYWQVAGIKKTTHGDIRVSGPRSPFIYYEGKLPENLMPLDKAAIKAALEKLGVTGLATLNLKWVMYDDSVVYVTDNITSVLQCLAESDIDFNVRWE